MNKIPTAVLVSGGGTNLQAIEDASARGEIPDADIALVLSSQSSAYALVRAEQAGIAHLALEKKAFPDRESWEQALEKTLAEHGIRLIVLAGFLSILSPEFTRRWDKRILNIHPSLIPSFCGQGFYGLKVHEAALERGVRITGATVHFVNEIPDGGEIIAQKAVAVQPGDTPERLQRRVMEEAEWILLPQALETVARNIREKEEHT